MDAERPEGIVRTSFGSEKLSPCASQKIMHCNCNHFAPIRSRSVTAIPQLLRCSSQLAGLMATVELFRKLECEDRVKILIASTPATGHLNPLLTIGRILIAEGHEVVGLSGSALRERIEGIGAEFRPLPAGADFDMRDILSVVPELKDIAPGQEWLRVAIERLFVDTVPVQHEGLEQVLRDFPAEIVIDHILVAQRDPENPLADHCRDRVLD
jgi:hypothetical protein